MAGMPRRRSRRRNPDEWHDRLEALVDAASLRKVLDALAGICGLKADHIREAWQDRGTASHWDRAAKVCDAASRKVTV